HAKAPAIPDEITEKDVEVPIRVALKTLSLENANRVARHLAMVRLLIDQDPQLAFEHAQAAAARAGRIAVVRETLGVAAYMIGDFQLALRELTTYRRLSGLNDQLPLMVDSERGVGRPDRALELGRSVDRATLEPEVRVNLAIALSGARLDRNENDLALAELEIAELNPKKTFDYSAPLFFAYGDVLEILGREAEAKKWLALAERAQAAFADTSAADGTVVEVLEEIEIPEKTTPTPRTDDSDGGRGFGGQRGDRDGGRGDRPRGDRDDRPRGERPARGDRPRRDDERPRQPRPERSSDESPKRQPWKRPE
ncbi:MAG: hypothetical protein RL670_526, partial [Actinomycetota bacterium]